MKNLRELVQEFALRMRLECAIVEELDDHSSRLYALEENRKLKDAAIKELRSTVQRLELMVRQQGQHHAAP